MSDLIDRQVAIEALTRTARDSFFIPDEYTEYLAWLIEVEDAILQLPAVQPDHVADVSKKVERTDETAQNVSDSDLVSRKVAIEAIMGQPPEPHYPSWYAAQIEKLPAVQPETATVTIGRIKGDVTMWYECDACGEPIDQKDCYCRNCGRKLKYE